MKILVMTDMEGVAGVLDHDNWVMPEGRFYKEGKRLLTEEVNAVIAGLRAGGATEIHVIDGHGAGGIDPDVLDRGVSLARARHPQPRWPWGLDATFDGLRLSGSMPRPAHPIRTSPTPIGSTSSISA